MLDRGKLAGLLHDRVFSIQNGTDFVQPMLQLAGCYRKYAQDARSCQSIAPLALNLAAAEVVMAGALATQLPGSRTPATFAQIIGTAGAAFWLLPPVTFVGGASPGAVVAAVPATLTAAVLRVIVASIASGDKLNARKVADLWASALHTWTKTVVAAHGPVPACSAPLT